MNKVGSRRNFFINFLVGLTSFAVVYIRLRFRMQILS